MGLISTLLTLPVSGPTRGAWWVVGKVHEAAEQEVSDPAAIRRALRAYELKLEAGEIDDDTFEELELVLLRRLRESSA